jgi:hypothetical protein
VRRLAKVLLTSAAALVIPVATTATADAAVRPETTMAGGAHLEVRLGGLHVVVHAGPGCVAESVTGRLLGVDQNLSIGC